MTSAVLQIDQLDVSFGGILALSSVDLVVPRNSIHAIIGPNGAGKSTLVNVVSGIYSANAGGVSFQGVPLQRLSPHKINRLGIARTFQNTELFGELTALENVMIGAHHRAGYGVLAAACKGIGFRQGEHKLKQRGMDLLVRVGIADDADTPAGLLPFGKQRRLELARALATDPTLLLLDEPAAGLRAREIEELLSVLSRLRTSGNLTIVLIDHVMALVMNISDRITVLNFGKKIAEGKPDEIRSNQEVIRAYLGERAANAVS